MVFTVVSTSLAQPPANLSGIKICIDPGHGGHGSNDRHLIPDAGLDFWESESNFQKALLLRPMLQAKGATVYLTRETNDYPNDADEPTLTARWTFANSNAVNWFHSIHSNATGGTNTSTNYTMVLLKEDKSTRSAVYPEAITMSSQIYNNIRARTRTNTSGGNSGTQGVYLDYTFYGGANGGFNLGVLNGLNMPGELSEGSFHDNYPETRRLLNNDYRKMEAYGIYNGILAYYGVTKDSVGIIAGLQLNSDNNKPQNSTAVRLLPLNKIYSGDQSNNGFYMFDSLQPGDYKIIFETNGFAKETVNVNVKAGNIVFVDKTILSVTPPFVQSITPGKGDTNIVNTTSISITFSKIMDTASVRPAFSIVPNGEGSLSWSNGNSTVTFTSKNYFQHSTQYTIQLLATAKSISGLFLDGNKDSIAGDTFTSTFKISKAIPPYVTLALPKLNDTTVSITSTIGIKFSKPMDTTSLKNAFSFQPVVSGNLTFSTDRTTLLFKPVSALQYNTSYTMKVAGTAFSFDSVAVDGNKDSVAGDDFVLQFKTLQNPAGVKEREDALPTEFSLHQNYPNPFNPATTIGFSIAELSSVSLKIYDVLGREVADIVNEKLNPGVYSIQWDSKNHSSGIYFYKLSTEKRTSVKRMMLVK